MSLPDKSIHELRGIAQAIGIDVQWAWDRKKLIKVIEHKSAPKPAPLPKESDIPIDSGLQIRLVEALKQYPSLVVTFPSPSTWQLTWGRKQDSGSIHMPIYAIDRCAKELMHG